MFSLGLDIGSISIKLAVTADGNDAALLEQAADAPGFFLHTSGGHTVLLSEYRRLRGGPMESAEGLLRDLSVHVPLENIAFAGITGSGSFTIAERFGLAAVNEFRAVAKAVGDLYPGVRTIFEMGGENSKYLRLGVPEDGGEAGITDYEKNGDCAAGTGSFMDQQASRLRYKIEDVGEVVRSAGKAPTIAGRCSVFAKSDMIHAQQKNYQPPEILKGLCEAVVRNFKGSITKGKELTIPIAFVGGVAANDGVVQAIRSVFNLDEDQLFVPEVHAWIPVIGASLLAGQIPGGEKTSGLIDIVNERDMVFNGLPTMEKLDMDGVISLRDRIKPYSFEGKNLPIEVHLGIDIGSVSTNLVLIDDEGDLVYEIYSYTDSRPIEVVNSGLGEMEREVGDRVRVMSVGTTGSGRELVGILVGADTINDEITAHKTGASYIGERLIDTTPDTIFEIGGQDSKFISLQDGVVVDFTMNEACAAGTGSFLQEQAEKLDVGIKGEFAARALSCDAPLKMGERCTVFMEKDVVAYRQQGASIDSVCAGLAYSVVQNYLNRVVQTRYIGDSIFFQGGTAYNDSVAAAFSKVLGKKIIVPPHNGVMGAIGMALIARSVVERKGTPTTFRGWSLDKVEYAMREFVCKGCSNHCDIQEFTVEGERTYWGDKCSDRYRKKAKVEHKPVIEDLIAARMEVLLGGYEEPLVTGRTRVGIPRAMYFYDQFPMWQAYLNALDVDVVVSDKSSKQVIHDGEESVVSEPCFPIKLAHGHVANLLTRQVDYIWMPNLIDGETEFPQFGSMFCPWGQTQPFVMRVSPRLSEVGDRWLLPTMHLRKGEKVVSDELWPVSKTLGANREKHRRAVRAGYEAQGNARAKLLALGQEALDTLQASDELGIVLLGRSYNIGDPGSNLNVPTKLRTFYGVNVIPMDMLPIEGIDVTDVNENMYWNYGRKILQAARFAADKPNLRLIYITNFQCGPDSYIKQFTGAAAGRPFLTLQFDAHANDAGTMTRCEAYLDSQGFFIHEPNPQRAVTAEAVSVTG
jgi:predicted CoA-substrate-specific enzyme activase